MALVIIIAVITACSFGVVKQAEALAHRLGDPYGSLVLTLSIVLIEVILISAVMLGPGEHATIARDSVMAVSMIILNLVIGICLIVGGRKYGRLRHNRRGAGAYLAMIGTLGVIAFGIPPLLEGGSYPTALAIPIAIATMVLYAGFLWRQMGPAARDFQEVDSDKTIQTGVGSGERSSQEAGSNSAAGRDISSASGDVGSDGGDSRSLAPTSVGVTEQESAELSIGAVLKQHRKEILARVLLLIGLVLPIVLLSHDMAVLVDEALIALGAPPALAGLLIAMIVFLPESITSVRAALAGEIQRVSNLCHGALVSTLALMIPAVLLIGMMTGQDVALAESSINLVLLGLTMLLTIGVFTRKSVSSGAGVAHLALFVAYVLALMI
ncbi:calcium:proton antiporter [Flaviflexus massiliensis]|uniref:calcium:proton antiporter n=1 Tax=Flaviflexus massiliensis TaxID=1522309 RepID=UPI001C9BD1A6|nr:hypothetical protein [Flaviflexus massiliensis]